MSATLSKEEFALLTEKMKKEDGGKTPPEMLVEALEMVSKQMGSRPKDGTELRRIDMPYRHWAHLMGFAMSAACALLGGEEAVMALAAATARDLRASGFIPKL